jgi:hypothetical protein
MIRVFDGGPRQVFSGPAATAAEAMGRKARDVTSGHIWHGTDQVASIENGALYGVQTKQKFATTGDDDDREACYLDGQPLDLIFETVNGGVRISATSRPDAIARFRKLAGVA